MIDKMPQGVMKVIGIIALLCVFSRIVIPRTSLYYRNWFFVPKFGDYLVDRDIVLVSGELFKIKINNINQRLTYQSTDYKVAYCNSIGIITADKPGLAFIKVKTKENTLVARVRVLSLNHSTLNLKKGESRFLNIRGNVLYETYQTDNKSVATVDLLGRVKAVGTGRCTITAAVRGRTMKCIVTVY